MTQRPEQRTWQNSKQDRTHGGRQVVHVDQQASCQYEKPKTTRLTRIRLHPAKPALAARRGRFVRPQETSAVALPPAALHVTRSHPVPAEFWESAHVSTICVASPGHRTVDPGGGCRQAR